MTLAMLCMINLCIQVRAKSDIVRRKDKKFTDFDMDHFWDWSDFQSYVECIFVFTVIGALLMYTFGNVAVFVEAVGFMAVFVEACLGVPQFLRNYKARSTRGMNLTMVLMWLCGDIFKTTYFILRNAPVQFMICGCLQIGVDLAILCQVWMFNSATPPPRAYVGS